MPSTRLIAAALFALLAQTAIAQVSVSGAFAVPTVPGAPTGAVYLSLHNKAATTDRLVSAITPRAKRVEMHSMAMSGNVMRMREIEAIEIRPGTRVDMKPGSPFHLMLVDLAAPLRAGDRFPLTLEFAGSGKLEVTVAVQAPKPAAGGHHHH
jgi:periplasmic copper chaperone A